MLWGLFMRHGAKHLIGAAVLALALPATAWAQDGEIVTKQYDDGSFYEGTFKDGRQDGIGTYRLPNGYEYTGEWVAGEIRGKGVARFPNGSVYEGQFAAGKPEGTGKITYSNGGSYEGDWTEGKMTGQGVARYPDGSVYTGAFVDGKHHGQGVLEGAGGFRYEGAWVDGVKEGKGKITYADGAVVRQWTQSHATPGQYAFQWNGMDDQGAAVPGGGGSGAMRHDAHAAAPIRVMAPSIR